MRYSWSKNNKEQRDKPKGLQCVTGCKGELKKGADGKWVAPCVLCPVHIGRHAKLLQALDAGVSVEELRAPVFSKVARIGKVPSGATLVVDENEYDAVLRQAGRLVLVITRKQEAEGLLYDGSMAFLLNGRKFRPPPRGVWFVVPGKGYAVFAWASASGVTHRIRKLMRKANARGKAEVMLLKTIEKLSSRSLRIAMATILSHEGVPMEEIVENGEWEDEAMCRTYVRSLDPLAVQRRNLSDVLFPASISTGASGGPDAGVGEGAGGGLEVVDQVPLMPVETLLNATELVAAMVEQEEGATSESTLGTALPEVQVVVGPAVTPAGSMLVTASPGVQAEGSVVAPKHKKRSECKPCHPQLWLKGKVFKRESIAGDAVLRRILEDTAGEKPAKVQDVLCAASYHVTRKEIRNHRERMALQATEAPEVDQQEMLLAIAE